MQVRPSGPLPEQEKHDFYVFFTKRCFELVFPKPVRSRPVFASGSFTILAQKSSAIEDFWAAVDVRLTIGKFRQDKSCPKPPICNS